MHQRWTVLIALATTCGAGCSGAAPDGDARVAGVTRIEGATGKEPGEGASLTVRTSVRLVNLISDAPAFDVCLRSHGPDPAAPFDIGPLLESHGLAAGLAYPEASGYVSIVPGTYDLRVVAAGAPDCATRLDGIPDRVDLPALDPRGHASLVAVGSLAKSFFALDVHSDEVTAAPDRAKLRFIHDTVAAPAFDVGMGAGGSFTTLFAAVPFRSAGAADPNGYSDVAPSEDATLVLRIAGRTFDTLSVPGFSLGEGTVTTVFSIGVAGAGGALVGSVLRCADGESAAPVSTCSTAP
jgi:hypothetical protein